MSDYINEGKRTENGFLTMDDSVYYDPEKDEWYMDVDEAIIDDGYILLDDFYDKADDGNRMLLQYMFLKKIRVYCMEGSYANVPIYFTINKLSSLYTKTMKNLEIPSFRVNNGMPWNESSSYIRTFVNGRFIPFDVTITSEKATDTYAKIDKMISSGDVFTLDLTPYSYKLEYSTKLIPENYIIDIEDTLSKPFSLDYYDIYLNGRKLTDLQVQSITPQRIKLFNVNSRKNLYIYRKDRDLEYFGFETFARVPMDNIFDSPAFPDDAIDDIIEDVIKHEHPDDDIKDGDDIEPDIETGYDEQSSDEFYQAYTFYIDHIRPCGVVKPNEDNIEADILMTKYDKIYETYSNKVDRIIFKPNARYDSSNVLMIGK